MRFSNAEKCVNGSRALIKMNCSNSTSDWNNLMAQVMKGLFQFKKCVRGGW